MHLPLSVAPTPPSFFRCVAAKKNSIPSWRHPTHAQPKETHSLSLISTLPLRSSVHLSCVQHATVVFEEPRGTSRSLLTLSSYVFLAFGLLVFRIIFIIFSFLILVWKKYELILLGWYDPRPICLGVVFCSVPLWGSCV